MGDDRTYPDPGARRRYELCADHYHQQVQRPVRGAAEEYADGEYHDAAYEPLVLLRHARRPGPLLDCQQRVGDAPGVHPGQVYYQEDRRRGGGAGRQAGGRPEAAHGGGQEKGPGAAGNRGEKTQKDPAA